MSFGTNINTKLSSAPSANAKKYNVYKIIAHNLNANVRHGNAKLLLNVVPV